MKSDNLVDYVRKAGNNWVADSRNNHFIYDENVNAAYINASKEFSKKWNVQTGLRMENTNTKGVQISNSSTVKRSYISPIPFGICKLYGECKEHAYRFCQQKILALITRT